MNDVLERIVEATRRRLAREQHDRPGLETAARASRDGKDRSTFRTALTRGGAPRTRLIAEIKSASPSAGTIVADPNVEEIAREYARGGAAAISIVTEPDFFRGSREWLGRAATASGLPVIMKDFVVDPLQIHRGVAAGADAVLLLASLLSANEIRNFISILDELGCDALVEVHDPEELKKACDAGATLIGVNNRDLRDFSVSLETSETLSALMPDGAIRVSESGIHSRQDVERLQEAGFHGFLVGESLLRKRNRVKAVRELVEEG